MSKYWNLKGKYQETTAILDEHVPMRGDCDEKNIDIYRKVRNAYYDYFNNGGCNGRIAELQYVRFEQGGKAWNALSTIRRLKREARGGYMADGRGDKYDDLLDGIIEELDFSLYLTPEQDTTRAPDVNYSY